MWHCATPCSPGGNYGSDLASLDRYFFHFAMVARAGR